MSKAVVAAVLAFALLGCQQPTRSAADSPTASREWDAFAVEFVEAGFVSQPQSAVRAGRHEFDGKLPDLSRAGIQKHIDELHAAHERAKRFSDANLDPHQRFERGYLLAEIESELFWLEEGERPWRNPGFYSYAMDPNVYVDREYAPLEQRMKAYTAYARALPGAAAHVRENLRTPLPRTYVQLGHIVFGGLVSFLEKDVPGVFAPVGDAKLRAEFDAANAGAVKAMKELDAWFKAEEASATEGYAIGAEKFLKMLRATEQVDVPLARLKEMGERDLERNLAALREACARFAPGESVTACVTRVQDRKPAEGPVLAAQRQLRELRAFIVERKVVTIPGPELAGVKEAPPYRRWNSAYIEVPGPYEKNLPSIYRIAPPDPGWTAAEQAAYIPGITDLLFISAHEVWPGHFLQHLHSDRSASMPGRLFRSYAFSEGWAHYAEEMMWEMGLGDGDPAVHVGELTNALLRDVRYLSAIGLHTGGMTVAESEAMFRDQAFQDPGNARQQAARGTFDPAYGNYTLGKLMIRKLRDDWTATHGGRQSWQAFHDRFLSYGAPPIPLVRKAMLGDDAGPPI
jgi:Bacterial protein of unknown function (DUF885)